MERKKVGKADEGRVRWDGSRVGKLGKQDEGETGTGDEESQTKRKMDAPYTEELASRSPKGDICSRKMMYGGFGEHGVVFHLRFA